MLSDRRGRSGLSATESSKMPGVSDNVNGCKEVCERQLFGIQEYPYESHTDPGGHVFPRSHKRAQAQQLGQETTLKLRHSCDRNMQLIHGKAHVLTAFATRLAHILNGSDALLTPLKHTSVNCGKLYESNQLKKMNLRFPVF
jgi:hypothetical protein